MDMIKEMINNMLGEYSKFIQIQDDGTVKVFVPEDVNNPSMENATELTLSKNEAISLMGLVTQPKQYEVCDSSNNCRIISEKDPCSGLGIETTISSRKIGEDKMKQIINIIK